MTCSERSFYNVKVEELTASLQNCLCPGTPRSRSRTTESHKHPPSGWTGLLSAASRMGVKVNPGSVLQPPALRACSAEDPTGRNEGNTRRCSHQHLPLLRPASPSATTSISLCSHQHLPLLRPASPSATTSISLCSHQHLPLLRPASPSAPTSISLCSHQHLPLLPPASPSAMTSISLCSDQHLPLLPPASPSAPTSTSLCYAAQPPSPSWKGNGSRPGAGTAFIPSRALRFQLKALDLPGKSFKDLKEQRIFQNKPHF
uniref:Uncharacterized protein n=1 Tax=Molossus molossus TaxID=27622 RepID=A0A7J8EFJ6_MOLMO|nr:hypothetical protein HJG59_008913 [Molossus molossus]